MQFKKVVLTGVAALALMSLAACGGQSEPKGPAEVPAVTTPVDFVWAQDVSDLKPDAAVRYGQLENGMRYAIMANDTPPQTASIRLRIDMGSTYEADDQQGLAHFIEHMAFNGSANVPEGEMIKMLERYGLAFGPDTNAYTSFDETVYQLDLPSVSDEVLNAGLFIMRETASNLIFDPEAIDRERGVVQSEERVRNSYGLRRFRSLSEFFLPGTVIPERFPIGKVEILQTAQRERFVDLYQRYYVPERATLVIVGDFDPDDIEARIRETYGDWQPVVEPGDDVDLGTVDATRPTAAGYFYDPDVPTFVSISGLRPYAEELDTAEQRKRDTIDSMGHAILSRRFDKLSRSPDSPIVSGSASDDEWFGVAEGPAVDLTAKPDTWDEALALGEQELRRALEFGFTQAELNEQIANYRTNLRNAVQQAATRETPRLADAITGAVNGDSVYTDAQSALDRFESYVDQLTPELIHEYFKAQWEGVNPLIHVSSNVEIENPEAAILAVWTESGKVAVEAPEATEEMAFAYTDFGTPGEVVSDAVIEDLGIRTIVFDNNVRLNLKKTGFEDGIVRISLRIGGGELEFPLDKEGPILMMSNFFSAGGLEAHSFDELQTILAGRSVSTGLAMGSDAFGGSFVTTPQDLELQMQVATAFLTAPGFRTEADAQARALLAVFYPTLDATPGGIVQRDVQRIIRSGDIRFGFGEFDQIANTTITELKPLIERAQREGAIEIAIVGDIDEQAAIDAVAATFGALPERRAEALPFDSARNVKFPASRDGIVLYHEGEANQALALVYWPVADGSDIREARVLSMLRSVFRLKLTDSLREELGATYSPDAGIETSNIYPGYGYMVASSEVEPANVEVVYETIDAIVRDMGEGGITDDEVERARTPILEGIDNQMEDNGVWLDVASQAQSDPATLDEFRRKREDYATITREELTAAAAKYLTPDAALRISVLSSKTKP